VSGTSGLFVCTHEKFITLPDEVLSESYVEVDELHKLLEMKNSVKKLHKSKQVFALSATLGSRIGKEKLK